VRETDDDHVDRVAACSGLRTVAALARYVVETDVGSVARALDLAHFACSGVAFPLVRFEAQKSAPCVLISPGSSGHAYLFAELGYRIHRLGFNVFILPKQGGRTISDLMQRHDDAVRWIRDAYNARVGIFGERLGGFATFYLALRGGGVRSIICQNSPAILTEPSFHKAILDGSEGAARTGGVGARLRAGIRTNKPLAKLQVCQDANGVHVSY
jgi:hypothetical protein